MSETTTRPRVKPGSASKHSSVAVAVSETTTKPRYTMTTADLAKRFHLRAPASIIRALSVRGNYLGMRPLKLSNGRLLWPENEVDEILEGVRR